MTQHEKLDALAEEGDIVFSSSGFPRYLQRPTQGVPYQDIWAYQSYTEGLLDGTDEGVDRDVKWLEDEQERLGYQTQKPLGVLQRIINSSSDIGDVVLDPFCGCGTAVHAAHKLGRLWIGIDITYLAVNLMETRMRGAFPDIEIEVIGVPKDILSARDLAGRSKIQFQLWAVRRLHPDAQPVGSKKGGPDMGIDGIIPLVVGGTAEKPQYKRAIVSVKGGEQIGVAMVRDLVGVLDRESEPIGVLLTLEPPTQPMTTEAASAGFYHNDLWQRDYPRVQIVTVEEMLTGKRPDIPPTRSPFAQAPTEREERRTKRLL
jgi:site-specific DNA-methyltransferase (adenine-specific)